MKWIYRIIARLSGCRHHWKIITEGDAHYTGARLPHARIYVLQCRKFGDIQQKVVGE